MRASKPCMGLARESADGLGGRTPPKEQPPRNLSGTQDRAGPFDTLESAPDFIGGHRRGKPGRCPGESSQVP